jgi:hypothetical protein
MTRCKPAYVLAALTVLAGAPALGVVALSATPAVAATACSGQIAGVSVYGGSGQVAKVATAYPVALEAEVVDTGGCPVTGADVEFLAPSSGAGGFFPGDAVAVTVATGTNGVATAPALVANEVSGSFAVVASISDFQASFALTNTTLGAVSSVVVSAGNSQSAAIGVAFGQALAVNVTDAYGDPVAGASVEFTVLATAGAGASFAGGATAATVTTAEDGTATAPALTAGGTPGPFTVTATVAGTTAAGTTAAGTTAVATFSLTDRAGVPDAIAAGVGSAQSAEAGSDFAVPLAVSVTDADANAVAGVAVVFAAPTSGPSGYFAGAGTTATVLTNSDGVATAPDFSADQRTGGYVVTATVAGVATPATFALVNQPRSAASAAGPDGTYWLVTAAGKVLRSGGAPGYGSLKAKATSAVVAMAALPDAKGYWLVSAKGKVYAFGAAVNYGSPAQLAKPIVAMAATADGKGYWLVGADGGVFNYGDAKFYGAPTHLAKPIVAMADTADGKGYWLVGADGGVFNYGDAKLYGTPARSHLAKPIVAMAATADGRGYWLATSAGKIYAYGDAVNFGAGLELSPSPVRALVRTADGAGYWVVSANGSAAGYGDAGAQGSSTVSAKTVVGGAA